MSEVGRVMNEMHEKLAKYREEMYDMPTHLVLDVGAKYALKMVCHPFTDPPLPDVEAYLGMIIIDLEKIIIVDSQSLAKQRGRKMVECPSCGSELVAVPNWNPSLFRGESNPITHYVCQNLECKGWYCDYCEEWNPFGTSCAVAMVRNERSGTNYQTMDLRGYDLYRTSCQKVIE